MLLDYNPFTGVTEQYHKDATTGRVTISKTQDVQKVMDSAASRRSDNNGWQGDFHHVASIPVIVIDMWREELKAKGVSNPDPLASENKPFLIAKINNSEFSRFRTKEGRI
jgi:hypothetical protein